MSSGFTSSVVFCVLSAVACAQGGVQPDFTIRIFGGEPFYTYTLRMGESLEQVAAAYAVETAAVVKANNLLGKLPAEGTVLRIPFSIESTEGKTATTASTPVVVKRADLAQPSKSTSQKRTETPEPVAVQPPAREESQVTPMQEAVALLSQPVAEQPSVPIHVEPVMSMEPIAESDAPELVANPETHQTEISALTEPETTFITSEPLKNEPENTGVNRLEGPSEDVVPDSAATALLADLASLSQSISQSLSNLEEMKKVLADEPLAMPTNSTECAPLSELLQTAMDNYFDTVTSAKAFVLKEFFSARIDAAGVVRHAVAEPTVTNANTRHLSSDLLSNHAVDGWADSLFQRTTIPIGLWVNAQPTTYHLKVKKRKIRVYDTPGFYETMPPAHPHFQLLMSAARNANQKGRCTATVVDGRKRLTIHKKFEYNPYGAERAAPLDEAFAYVMHLEFKRP